MQTGEGATAHLPLAGLRVLDLSRFFAGGYCTLLLADLGADVMKVEPPGGGDPLRALPSAHAGLNRGKRSMTLDTRADAGLGVLRRLVRSADVLVENQRPGAMDAAGFGYAQAAAENPGLVWCSISGFGQDGPYAPRPGHDLTYVGQSGLLDALVPGEPFVPQTMLAVPVGSLVAVSGILAALVARQTTGRGAQVDASLSDAAAYLLSGEPGRGRAQQGIPFTAGRHVYRCSDGRYVTVAAAEPRTWSLLCKGLGLDDLAGRLGAPPQEQAAMSEQLAAAFREQPAAAWVERLGAAGAAVGPLNSEADLATDPHSAARGATVEVDGFHVPANPLRFRDVAGPWSSGRADGPPPLGADTAAALSAAGFGADEIAALREHNTI